MLSKFTCQSVLCMWIEMRQWGIRLRLGAFVHMGTFSPPCPCFPLSGCQLPTAWPLLLQSLSPLVPWALPLSATARVWAWCRGGWGGHPGAARGRAEVSGSTTSRWAEQVGGSLLTTFDPATKCVNYYLQLLNYKLLVVVVVFFSLLFSFDISPCCIF